MWHWGIIRHIWRAFCTDLHEYLCVLLTTLAAIFDSNTSTVVHGNTYLHMYGPHMHKRTTMMRMLWVTMGNCVCFVAVWVLGLFCRPFQRI